MSIFSFPTLLGFCIATIVFNLLPGRMVRRVWLTLLNLGFLLSMGAGKQNLLGFFVFIVGTFCILKFFSKRRSTPLMFGAIFGMIAFFLFVKKYSFWALILPAKLVPDHLLFSMTLVGVSYMLFKFIHMLVDQSQEQLAPYTFASYVNYQLGFFTLIAGPIQRYNDYHSFWESMGAPADPALAPTNQTGADRDYLIGWNRIFSGMIKLGIVSAYFSDVFKSNGAAMDTDHPVDFFRHFATFFYAYPFYMYFNFSGYTDVMIGFAQQFGLTLPENFDGPYLARNVVDYWNRWHMTLTHWIRDYIFMASYKQVVMTAPRLARAAGTFLIFFALLIAGIWHGSTAAFALFGALHGIGAATSQLYGDILQNKLTPDQFDRYMRNPVIRTCAVLVTFHFVCFCFLFFSSGIEPALHLLNMLGRQAMQNAGGIPNQLAIHAALVASAAIILYICFSRPEKLTALSGRFSNSIQSSSSRAYLLIVAKAVVVVLALYVAWGFNQNQAGVAYMKF